MAQETAQQKLVRETSAETLRQLFERLGPPRDQFGSPLVRISAASAELVPTQQFGNATVGPVIVERWVVDGGDEAVKAEIKKLQAMVEDAVAEDRQTLHEQIRARAA